MRGLEVEAESGDSSHFWFLSKQFFSSIFSAISSKDWFEERRIKKQPAALLHSAKREILLKLSKIAYWPVSLTCKRLILTTTSTTTITVDTFFSASAWTKTPSSRVPAPKVFAKKINFLVKKLVQFVWQTFQVSRVFVSSRYRRTLTLKPIEMAVS